MFNMKRKLTRFASIVFACVMFFNCSEDDTKQIYQKVVLNISDATSLAVLEASSGGRMKEGQSNFYKIIANGSMEEVKFVNADGTHIDSNVSSPIVEVFEIIDLNASML